MNKKFLLYFITVLGVMFIVSGCSSSSSDANSNSQDSDGNSGGELKFGLAGEPDTMDGMVQNGTHGRTIKLAIYRGLFNYNKSGELQAELADDHSISDDG